MPPSPPRGLRLAREYDHKVVEAHLRRADWERLCRGAYAPLATPLRGERRALAVMLAMHERLRAPHWFSHESAAIAWGLPVWRIPTVTHVRQASRPGGTRDRTVLRHGGFVDETHLTSVGGLPVTDLEQTMLDCARSLRPLAGLVVADAALRAGADRAVALRMLDELGAARGVARARAVIEVADDGAESPGESAMRFVVLRDGLPRPMTQIPVTTDLGVFWADAGWDEWKVLLEYDGRSKYTDPEAMIREKRRQDALLETGARVLRVTKEDIPWSARVTHRVLRLLPPGIPIVRRPLLRA